MYIFTIQIEGHSEDDLQLQLFTEGFNAPLQLYTAIFARRSRGRARQNPEPPLQEVDAVGADSVNAGSESNPGVTDGGQTEEVLLQGPSEEDPRRKKKPAKRVRIHIYS